MTHIKELIQTLINTFLHNPNQFASGGLLLMAIGALGASLRKIPSDIWSWVVHQTTVSMSLTDDQRAFYWVKMWLENQRLMKRVRHIDIYNHGTEKYVVVPAPGHHWMLYRGRILSITITRTEEKKMAGSYTSTVRPETITFKTVGRKQAIFRQMMEDVKAHFVKQEEKKPELYAWGSWSEWQKVHAYQPRSLDTVILSKDDKERTLREITAFRDSREWYRQMGIPYRKGLLFYGPPGTGKTSFVTGLSSHFKSNVYILKLADMTDATLCEAVKGVEPNSFLIVEDIDGIAAAHNRNKKEKEGKEKNVTLSGLLNVLDGLLSPAGAVFILTTNHKEKLDPALTRPGRVDLQLHMTYADNQQKKALWNRFFTGDCPEKYVTKKMTMAELQQELMNKRLKESETPTVGFKGDK